PTSPATQVAKSALVACSDTYRPRRDGGAASSKNAVLGPTSPPNANPCTRRNTMTRMGAKIPIDAYEGVSDRPVAATPIKPSDNTIAGLRPARSPNLPITNAPSGLVRNPTPKVASDDSRLRPGVVEGKKVRPICAAKKAYVTKS